jgi:hypothetical protein
MYSGVTIEYTLIKVILAGYLKAKKQLIGHVHLALTSQYLKMSPNIIVIGHLRTLD